MTASAQKLLFVDRDGTLVCEPPDEQVDRVEKVALVEAVIPSLLALRRAGYSFVMVTNQDGLGSEQYPQACWDRVQPFILDLFGSQGIEFVETLVCPHRAAEGCSCRKPKTGLVQRYLADPSWDRERAAVVGDRLTDLELAAAMGIRGFRLEARTGWAEISGALLGTLRRAQVSRKTRETAIRVAVTLDGEGRARIATGIGFFDHMLEQLAKHGGFDLEVAVTGDLHVDEHHTVEDTALALGEALRRALGDKAGIERYGFLLPMDEASAQVALDLSGRAFSEVRASFGRERVGGLATEMVPHFFRSLADALGATLHLEARGDNTHHLVEAMFKSVGRALRQAVRQTGQGVPSTKGIL